MKKLLKKMQNLRFLFTHPLCNITKVHLDLKLICCHTIRDLVATLMISYLVRSSMVLVRLGILMAQYPEAVLLVTNFFSSKNLIAYILACKIWTLLFKFFFFILAYIRDLCCMTSFTHVYDDISSLKNEETLMMERSQKGDNIV